jgi:hypothetical protein
LHDKIKSEILSHRSKARFKVAANSRPKSRVGRGPDQTRSFELENASCDPHQSMPKCMLQTYDGFPTQSTESRKDKLTPHGTLSNIAKKRYPMSHRHHNTIDLRAKDLSIPQSHHFDSIYTLPYSRNQETP